MMSKKNSILDKLIFFMWPLNGKKKCIIYLTLLSLVTVELIFFSFSILGCHANANCVGNAKLKDD